VAARPALLLPVWRELRRVVPDCSMALASTITLVAFDAAGTGKARVPHDVSRSEHVADGGIVIEQMGLEPCAVIGQSMAASRQCY